MACFRRTRNAHAPNTYVLCDAISLQPRLIRFTYVTTCGEDMHGSCIAILSTSTVNRLRWLSVGFFETQEPLNCGNQCWVMAHSGPSIDCAAGLCAGQFNHFSPSLHSFVVVQPTGSGGRERRTGSSSKPRPQEEARSFQIVCKEGKGCFCLKGVLSSVLEAHLTA